MEENCNSNKLQRPKLKGFVPKPPCGPRQCCKAKAGRELRGTAEATKVRGQRTAGVCSALPPLSANTSYNVLPPIKRIASVTVTTLKTTEPPGHHLTPEGGERGYSSSSQGNPVSLEKNDVTSLMAMSRPLSGEDIIPVAEYLTLHPQQRLIKKVLRKRDHQEAVGAICQVLITRVQDILQKTCYNPKNARDIIQKGLDSGARAKVPEVTNEEGCVGSPTLVVDQPSCQLERIFSHSLLAGPSTSAKVALGAPAYKVEEALQCTPSPDPGLSELKLSAGVPDVGFVPKPPCGPRPSCKAKAGRELRGTAEAAKVRGQRTAGVCSALPPLSANTSYNVLPPIKRIASVTVTTLKTTEPPGHHLTPEGGERGYSSSSQGNPVSLEKNDVTSLMAMSRPLSGEDIIPVAEYLTLHPQQRLIKKVLRKRNMTIDDLQERSVKAIDWVVIVVNEVVLPAIALYQTSIDDVCIGQDERPLSSVSLGESDTSSNTSPTQGSADKDIVCFTPRFRRGSPGLPPPSSQGSGKKQVRGVLRIIAKKFHLLLKLNLEPRCRLMGRHLPTLPSDMEDELQNRASMTVAVILHNVQLFMESDEAGPSSPGALSLQGLYTSVTDYLVSRMSMMSSMMFWSACKKAKEKLHVLTSGGDCRISGASSFNISELAVNVCQEIKDAASKDLSFSGAVNSFPEERMATRKMGGLIFERVEVPDALPSFTPSQGWTEQGWMVEHIGSAISEDTLDNITSTPLFQNMDYSPATTPSEGRASTLHTLQDTITQTVMDHALFTSGLVSQREFLSKEKELELVRVVIGIFIDQSGALHWDKTCIAAESLVDKVIVACNIVMVILRNYYTAHDTIIKEDEGMQELLDPNIDGYPLLVQCLSHTLVGDVACELEVMRAQPQVSPISSTIIEAELGRAKGRDSHEAFSEESPPIIRCSSPAKKMDDTQPPISPILGRSELDSNSSGRRSQNLDRDAGVTADNIFDVIVRLVYADSISADDCGLYNPAATSLGQILSSSRLCNRIFRGKIYLFSKEMICRVYQLLLDTKMGRVPACRKSRSEPVLKEMAANPRLSKKFFTDLTYFIIERAMKDLVENLLGLPHTPPEEALWLNDNLATSSSDESLHSDNTLSCGVWGSLVRESSLDMHSSSSLNQDHWEAVGAICQVLSTRVEDNPKKVRDIIQKGLDSGAKAKVPEVTNEECCVGSPTPVVDQPSHQLERIFSHSVLSGPSSSAKAALGAPAQKVEEVRIASPYSREARQDLLEKAPSILQEESLAKEDIQPRLAHGVTFINSETLRDIVQGIMGHLTFMESLPAGSVKAPFQLQSMLFDNIRHVLKYMAGIVVVFSQQESIQFRGDDAVAAIVEASADRLSLETEANSAQMHKSCEIAIQCMAETIACSICDHAELWKWEARSSGSGSDSTVSEELLDNREALEAPAETAEDDTGSEKTSVRSEIFEDDACSEKTSVRSEVFKDYGGLETDHHMADQSLETNQCLLRAVQSAFSQKVNEEAVETGPETTGKGKNEKKKSSKNKGEIEGKKPCNSRVAPLGSDVCSGAVAADEKRKKPSLLQRIFNTFARIFCFSRKKNSGLFPSNGVRAVPAQLFKASPQLLLPVPLLTVLQ
ncbi:uncharacterized protein LOC115206338 isoform X1 [Salmo trutta]|uniref:uncharacterized protein LOC115206338 isoform X1 n=1 Tax=Salmo trutta TaxID=8032 RepID=UPI0011325CFE|nr:uncharacterized protein LOC115206338 isoform X1 [Salmo trutta]XP_029629019.1 uncharacterized protein LOC115206338 isoform X1 [Salmo trutta]XP_029629020.1 uncharacterized protein LOC115206338 isoform X1 [Salmo trutta]XP_029629021.1 uncharacterized protein LOC115206338 isoform X1 [Salmo trutta]XP_029629022.1 uncharacterized protein LOC115206338 isoform X1 [Salmo trutta]XP_029629023.1 uncharacterized protein LOC115206338 isoform X1 [Salmo trutta]